MLDVVVGIVGIVIDDELSRGVEYGKGIRLGHDEAEFERRGDELLDAHAPVTTTVTTV